MKAPKNHGIQCRLWLATGLVALLLGGCASGPGSTPPSPLDAELASLTQLTGAEQALQLATQLRALNRAGQYSLAVALAAQVPIDPALGTPYIQVVRQVATALIGTNDYAGATDLIQTALEQAPTSDDDRAALLALKVQAQDGNRDPRGAMASLIEIISLTPPDATGRWLGDLWARAQLNSDLAILGDDTVSGWIALAQATQTGDPAAVRDWRAAWPDHPAMLVLPAEAEALLARGWSTPRRIGVILPLSGPLVQVGANLLDGIMSEQLKQRDITLIVADGQQGPAAAIAELTAQQVDLIVGPLPKGEVNQAITIARDIPLLTLNYSDVESTNTAPLAQMGLAPEDAAADAARIMLQAPEDTRRPIVLVPGDEIGTRVATAFQQQWSEQTGQAPIVAPYLNDDQRQVVANVTGIADSQARKQQLQRVLNTELEFTPRRRADLSAVYLYGDAVTAAQLKPLLAFYYAGDLPVWVADAALDRDLDLVRGDLVGANLVAMPWQLDSLGDSNVLFELGRDAWTLATQMARLDTGDTVSGRTGTWSLEGERIGRTLTPARLGADGFTPLDRPTPPVDNALDSVTAGFGDLPVNQAPALDFDD